MNYNTSKCQEIFRIRFTGASRVPFKDFKDGKSINNMPADAADINAYKIAKKDDIINFYYKSLLSFSEGLAAVQRKNYTWATIKLYYSLFFGLRSSLLCKDVVLLRAMNHMYRLSLSKGKTYEKPKGTNDHAATLITYINMYEKSDFFCSNPIEEQNAYQWLKNCREIVNYKDEVFHDPSTTSLWTAIAQKIEKDGIIECLNDFVANKSHYCFSPDFAVIALPLNRVLTVVQEVKNECDDFLSLEQEMWIENVLRGMLDDELIKQLLNRCA